jgi:hypothetical protein
MERIIAGVNGAAKRLDWLQGKLFREMAQANVIETSLKLTSCLCNIELHVVQLCANDLRMGKEGLYGESQE